MESPFIFLKSVVFLVTRDRLFAKEVVAIIASGNFILYYLPISIVLLTKASSMVREWQIAIKFSKNEESLNTANKHSDKA